MLRNTVIILFLTLVGSQVAAQSDSVRVKEYVIEGNKKTKSWVIIKEGGTPVGSSIQKKNLEEELELIRNNIRNLQHFNSVQVQHILLPENEILILVEVVERWFIYPVPVLTYAEPNFNIWWQNKDFSRTNYGLRLIHTNFRGRDEELELKLQFGFSREFALIYTTPYLDRSGVVGLDFKFRVSENDEFNYGTFNNQRLFLSDGSGKTRQDREVYLGLRWRPDIYTTHRFGIRNGHVGLADTVLSVTNDYLSLGQRKMDFMGLEYHFNQRKVDRKAYPLKGYEVEAWLKQDGLGVFDSSPSVTTFTAIARKYVQLDDRVFLHGMLKLQTKEGNQIPYYLQRGLGYSPDLVRGHEFDVVDGQRFFLLRSNLKYELLGTRSMKIPYLKDPAINQFYYAFYLNLIGDLGYVQDELYGQQNPRNNELLGGTGLGLDLVLGYDQVFSINWAVNRLNRTGFYFSYKKSI